MGKGPERPYTLSLSKEELDVVIEGLEDHVAFFRSNGHDNEYVRTAERIVRFLYKLQPKVEPTYGTNTNRKKRRSSG
jgi:hypothetical protein